MNSDIPPKTRRELGWTTLLAALAELTRSPVGRERALELPFLPSHEEIERQLARVAEARRLTARGEEIPLADTPDARGTLVRAQREGVLEPVALLACARLIRASAGVRRFLGARREAAPLLAEEAGALSEFEPLAAEIERAIEPSGLISDRASPALAELRGRARALHRQIKERLEELLADPVNEEVLRDRYFSIRDERYVVPVKTSHQARLPGIVHNASQSGQTLFIEPDALVDLGNHLTIAQSLALEEERRILRDLSDGIGRRAEELGRDLELLAEFDRVGAAARLADRLGATAPEAPREGEPFALRGLRHPLLVLRGIDVVPNDVALEPGRRGLVISGPNAGGKTVTMTAVGLAALMLRAGLPVPAERGSRLAAPDAVLTAIGDEGDLSLDLSTFTAHLAALKEIAARSRPGALVCIDEIAAGTDPREGAALASAFVDDLVERGAVVLVTTHLDELKAKALTDERLVCASVEFDKARLSPTYRLKMNEAGSSSAIEIARRVGISEAVCDAARGLLGGSGGALGRALEAVEQRRAGLERVEAALEQERRALAAARAEWERQSRELKARSREVTAGARRELLAEIESARAEVRRTLAELQSRPAVPAAVQSAQRLEKLAARELAQAARDAAQEEAERTEQAADPGELRPGLRVRVASLGGEGEILALDAEAATVRVGALKTRVPRADLVPLKGRAAPARFRRTTAEREEAVSRASAGRVRAAVEKLDLRGLRTEDALRQLRDTLDRALREGTPELVVLHGHGSGALKAAVREELSTSPYVGGFRPGLGAEGGDAVTVAAVGEPGGAVSAAAGKTSDDTPGERT